MTRYHVPCKSIASIHFDEQKIMRSLFYNLLSISTIPVRSARLTSVMTSLARSRARSVEMKQDRLVSATAESYCVWLFRSFLIMLVVSIRTCGRVKGYVRTMVMVFR